MRGKKNPVLLNRNVFVRANHALEDKFQTHRMGANAASLEVVAGTVPLSIMVSDGVVVIFTFKFCFEIVELDAVAFFRIAFSLLDLTD